MIDATTAATMHDTIGRLANAIDDSRSFGTEHEGYHLVIAYCVEGLQQHLAA